MPTYYVIGAGFSGAVLARELAENADARIVVFDQRDHLGGNCHTERDDDTGIMVHKYGPHTFNTDNEEVWGYVNRFATFRPALSQVKASTPRGVFSLPINLHTINQFYGTRLSPAEASDFLTARAIPVDHPSNFEEYALSVMGEDLYRAFIHGYTRKQWGCDPSLLPVQIIKRLPLRFDYNSNYYSTRHQGIPAEGYTALIANILDHPQIETILGTPFHDGMKGSCDHLFFTGALDAYFGHLHGRLSYRTVYWETLRARGDHQGNPIINYTDLSDPQTRVIEPKHFTPWETHRDTVVQFEHSKETEPADIPYYPKRLPDSLAILGKYVALAGEETGTTFLGRLATYRYLNMDLVIAEALRTAGSFLDWKTCRSSTRPVFSSSPLGE